MKNIIYFTPDDATKFDFERFEKSINSYADVPAEDIKKALKEEDKYENMHVSVLVKIGAELIEKFGGEKAAKKYYVDHEQYFGEKFERLRRITGYLVGTLDRWNDGKKAEEAARVKHCVNSSIDDAERATRLEMQAMEQNVAYTR